MRLIDQAQIVAGFIPVNMATGANNGDYVSLRNYRKCTVLFFKGAGADPEDPVLTFEQAQDVAATGEKNLAIITEYWRKEGADLAAIGTFTRVTQAASQTVTLSAASAESAGLYVFEIDASELDVDNGFDCLRVSVADVGNTEQLGCLLYILREPRHATETMPSAIID